MTKLPPITGKAAIRTPGKAGFSVDRIRGSHHFLKHPDGRTATVPVHKGETIGIGLLARILRDVEIERDDFIALLK